MKIVLIRHAKSRDNIKPMPVEGRGYKLYAADSDISKETAKALWLEESFDATELLCEFEDGGTESKDDAITRAREFLDKIERDGSDVIAISHEHFLKLLFKQLRKRGYQIKRSNLFKIDYLEKAIASKRSDRCGGCTHDCQLSNPGCDIGREKALRSKLQ